jgi:hypothetical protein
VGRLLHPPRRRPPHDRSGPGRLDRAHRLAARRLRRARGDGLQPVQGGRRSHGPHRRHRAVEHRIRVNVIHPGWIDTPGEREHATEEEIASAAAKLPWKRLGRPDEVARGVVFLCDPKSDYITGTTLGIDGGITLPWWANRGSAVPE